MKSKSEESLKSETKKLEKERENVMRAIQEVQCLINRDFREETKDRGRNCQIHSIISLGSSEKWTTRDVYTVKTNKGNLSKK